MLIVHYLHRSQSERIVWLCEELGLEPSWSTCSPGMARAASRDKETRLWGRCSLTASRVPRQALAGALWHTSRTRISIA